MWINEGAEVISYPNLHQLEMTHVYFSERTHTRAHLQQARANGFQVGVYSNPQWYGGATIAKVYRDIVSKRLTTLGVDDEQCDVMFNIEKGWLVGAGFGSLDASNQYMVDLFYWWRRARAKRMTWWTMEGHQGGWFYPAFRHPNLAGTVFVPQAYDGAMGRWDSAGVVKDLYDYGVSLPRVVPFLDAPESRVPYSYGFFYLENRLYP